MNKTSTFLVSLDFLEYIKGVVCSRIFRGYVKVDGLGEILLFTQTKLDKIGRELGCSIQLAQKMIFVPLF